MGSGFIIDEKGTVVTNNHVIQDAEDIIIRVNGDKEYKAKVIGYACIIDRSIGKSKIKDKIVSQVQLDIPTYKKDNLPKELISIKPIKPGSRNL